MIWLGLLLLLAVLFTHYAPELVSSFYPEAQRQAAAKAWFYVARGVKGTVLYAVVLLLAWMLAAAVRRIAARRLQLVGVTIACAWGVFEEAQTATCRLADPIGEAPDVSPITGLCDHVTGLPIYAATLFAGLVVASLARESGDVAAR